VRLDLPEPLPPPGATASREGPKDNLGAKLDQATPNKTKQKSLDFLGFPWIYSSESGLFNGL
jgi:hypothetical protein